MHTYIEIHILIYVWREHTTDCDIYLSLDEPQALFLFINWNAFGEKSSENLLKETRGSNTKGFLTLY